jgi:hypothetical protein
MCSISSGANFTKKLSEKQQKIRHYYNFSGKVAWV